MVQKLYVLSIIGLDNWTNNSSGLISGRKYTLYIENDYLNLIDINLKKKFNYKRYV